MTGTIKLPLALGADGTTGNEFPAISYLTSGDADNPKVRMAIAAFDDTTNETLCWAFRLPANYASGGTLKGHWYPMVSSTSKNVIFRAALVAVTPGDSINMTTLDPVNAGGGWASVTEGVVPTSKYPDSFSLTLNMNAAAAGDSIVMIFQRDAANASDDYVGDIVMMHDLDLEYTTT